MKRRSRAEDYMQQSLPYLRDSQSSVRLAAVRFIGESQPWPLLGQPGHVPALHWQQPCGHPNHPVQSLSLPLLLATAWAWWSPLSVPLPVATSLSPTPCGHLSQSHSLWSPHSVPLPVAAGGPWASPEQWEGGRAGVTLLGALWEQGMMQFCAQGSPRGT